MDNKKLKCNNCGAPQTSINKKDGINHCLFCHEPIHRDISDNVIKDIVLEIEEEFFLSPHFFSVIVSRLDTRHQKLLKLIRLVINNCFHEKIYDLRFENKTKQKSMLQAISIELFMTTNIDIKDAKMIVNYFAEALNLNIENISEEQPLLPYSGKPLIKINNIYIFGDSEWYVLEKKEDTLLLLSKNILDIIPYHSKNSSITWEKSTMRKYLNSVFLRRFTIEEQHRIIETQIINNGNLWYDIKGGKYTKDKIFLLSFKELDKYFRDSDDFQKNTQINYNKDLLISEEKGVYFSNADNNKRIALLDNKPCFWWLRSPGGGNYPAIIVDHDGRVLVRDNFYCKRGCYFHGGLRPALWVWV